MIFLRRARHVPGRRRAALVVALALGLAHQHGAAAPTADEAEPVRRAFHGLKTALARGDGQATAALLSRSSWSYSRDLQRVARQGSRGEIEALDPPDRLAVLALRHNARPYLLREESPRALVSEAVAARRLEPAQIGRAQLGPVRIVGERASADLRVDRLPTGFAASFVREAASWKLDLAPTVRSSREYLRLAAQLSGTSETDVIVRLLARSSGRPPGAALWEPPVRRPASAAPR